MIAEWRQPGVDKAWLIYSANYIFRTGIIRWAIDPFRLCKRLPDAPFINYVEDLRELTLVLLTHAHADHLDLELISGLHNCEITWVIPEFMLSILFKRINLPRNRIIISVPGQLINFKGLIIFPFEGQHFHQRSQEQITQNERPRGVPAMGYLVEFNGKRWLFPGDTRNLTPEKSFNFGPVDIDFAHLWLGKSSALEQNPPFLQDFYTFHTNLLAHRIVITHLEELGRDEEDYWDAGHYAQVEAIFHQLSPDIHVEPAYLGDGVNL
jgi:phosphoribosyl 1,2-cyclic phosphodiesterase